MDEVSASPVWQLQLSLLDHGHLGVQLWAAAVLSDGGVVRNLVALVSVFRYR